MGGGGGRGMVSGLKYRLLSKSTVSILDFVILSVGDARKACAGIPE
jgi:hypothetical protein